MKKAKWKTVGGRSFLEGWAESLELTGTTRKPYISCTVKVFCVTGQASSNTGINLKSIAGLWETERKEFIEGKLSKYCFPYLRFCNCLSKTNHLQAFKSHRTHKAHSDGNRAMLSGSALFMISQRTVKWCDTSLRCHLAETPLKIEPYTWQVMLASSSPLLTEGSLELHVSGWNHGCE